MHPELLAGIRAYPTFLVLGDIVGFTIALEMGRRAGVKRSQLLASLVVLTAVAFGGAKIFAISSQGAARRSMQT